MCIGCKAECVACLIKENNLFILQLSKIAHCYDETCVLKLILYGLEVCACLHDDYNYRKEVLFSLTLRHFFFHLHIYYYFSSLNGLIVSSLFRFSYPSIFFDISRYIYHTRTFFNLSLEYLKPSSPDSMLPVQVTGVRKSEYDRLMVTTALLLIACPGSGSKFYDLLLVSKKQSALDGAKSCRSYGYDGLASVHSPEAFTYAKKISYDQW